MIAQSFFCHLWKFYGQQVWFIWQIEVALVDTYQHFIIPMLLLGFTYYLVSWFKPLLLIILYIFCYFG